VVPQILLIGAITKAGLVLLHLEHDRPHHGGNFARRPLIGNHSRKGRAGLTPEEGLRLAFLASVMISHHQP
jgi:hypothetical protein